MNTSYKLIDEPEEGCAKGKILDSDEDHNLFAEFGLYYKSPSVAALPAGAAEPRLEPAPEGVNEAEINVQAAAAADPTAAGLAVAAGPADVVLTDAVAEPRLEPAPEGVNEAEINVQAAAAVDPAAAGLAAVAAPSTAANAMATFAALL